MGMFLGSSDLPAGVGSSLGLSAEQMIEDAEALAVLVAPCLTGQAFDNGAAVRAILRGAIMRWSETGTGALQQQAAGPFSQTFDTRQERRGMFWPSEITQLQGLCASGQKVYTLSLAGPDLVV